MMGINGKYVLVDERENTNGNHTCVGILVIPYALSEGWWLAIPFLCYLIYPIGVVLSVTTSVLLDKRSSPLKQVLRKVVPLFG
ncbi:hypothetical protein LguiB_024920 [Lonicera macranthoides]